MAQSIKNISIGSKIRDAKGNEFTVIAKNHYGSNQVTLMHTNGFINMQMHDSYTRNSEYGLSEVHYYLSNDYLKTLQEELKDNNKVDLIFNDTSLTSGNHFIKTNINEKFYIISPLKGNHLYNDLSEISNETIYVIENSELSKYLDSIPSAANSDLIVEIRSFASKYFPRCLISSSKSGDKTGNLFFQSLRYSG